MAVPLASPRALLPLPVRVLGRFAERRSSLRWLGRTRFARASEERVRRALFRVADWGHFAFGELRDRMAEPGMVCLEPVASLAPPPPEVVHIEVRDPGPPRSLVARWLRALESDAGCGAVGEEGSHAACAAARKLAGLCDPPPELVSALTRVLLTPGRPSCVRRAAARALRSREGEEAQLALERARAVVQKRLAWDGRPGDLSLLSLLA